MLTCPGGTAGGAPSDKCQALTMVIEGLDELRIAEFGSPGELRDRLVAAILVGENTATTGLLVEWELDGEPFPQPGEQMLVVDSAEVPAAVIEIEGVSVVRLADVDMGIAIAEGEGYVSLEEWRAAHEAFWSSYAGELRARLADPSWQPVDDTPVVVERFRLIERLGT